MKSKISDCFLAESLVNEVLGEEHLLLELVCATRLNNTAQIVALAQKLAASRQRQEESSAQLEALPRIKS